MVINTVGPTWEGNQVWFILGGGAIFAAWPFVYTAGFYLAMFLVLAALILRPVGFKYRSKRPGAAWRARWDWALFLGGAIPALVFGVAVGNVLEGVPLRLDSDLRSFYESGLLGLFSPFALLYGLLSVAMVVLHGSAFLSSRSSPARSMTAPARSASGRVWPPWRSSPSAGSGSPSGGIGFRITSATLPGGPSNLLRTTSVAQGAPVRRRPMWYFTWILGVGLAVLFGVVNGLWHEFHMPLDTEQE
jgi:cytochrome d ubiquinol oxidase subunit II